MTKNLNKRDYYQSDYYFPGVSKKKIPIDLHEPIWSVKMSTGGSWNRSLKSKSVSFETQKKTKLVEKTDSLLKKTACFIRYRYPTSFQKTAPTLSSKEKMREAERDRLMQKLSSTTPECMKRGTFYSEQPRLHNCSYGNLPYRTNKSLTQNFGKHSSPGITYILNHKIGSVLLKERFKKDSTKKENEKFHAEDYESTNGKFTSDSYDRNGTFKYSYTYNKTFPTDDSKHDEYDSNYSPREERRASQLPKSESDHEESNHETKISSRVSTARTPSSGKTNRSDKRDSIGTISQSDDDDSIAKSYEKRLYAQDSDFSNTYD